VSVKMRDVRGTADGAPDYAVAGVGTSGVSVPFYGYNFPVGQLVTNFTSELLRPDY
jgi:hypothetical protein